MIYFRKIELDENDFAILHDRIFGVFEVDIKKDQLEKLFELTPNWDGECDTLGVDQFIDYITNYFVNMKVPMYGSTKEYKDKFWVEVEKAKPRFVEFIYKK